MQTDAPVSQSPYPNHPKQYWQEAEIADCLEEASGNVALITKALGDIARARGMSQVARDAGLSRESLYKALSGERSPGFDTILKVLRALGLKLHAEAIHVNNPMAPNKSIQRKLAPRTAKL